ncbi:MAG: hypothetical protein K2X02_01640 [Alphaproteobacteria bacterium]|nr:hypothetical protein [Alphaproteobacteria bacterium]
MKNNHIVKISKLKTTSHIMESLSKLADDIFPAPINIIFSSHAEMKLAEWVLMFHEKGFNTLVYPSHPSSISSKTVDYLQQNKIKYIPRVSDNLLPDDLEMIKSFSPHLIFDDGAVLIDYCADNRKDFPQLIGAIEFTTTGSNTLKKYEDDSSCFPIFDVGDSYCKHKLCNGPGTGFSTLITIFNLVNINLAGKNVLIIGYGEVGKGVAKSFSQNGSNIIVWDNSVENLVAAYFNGYKPDPEKMLLNKADIVVTCSGDINVFGKDELSTVKDEVIIANVGCFSSEIDFKLIEENSIHHDISDNHVDTFTLKNGKKITILSKGNLVNISSGNGWPIEQIDLNFAVSTLCFQELLSKKEHYSGLCKVPQDLEQKALETFLKEKVSY